MKQNRTLFDDAPPVKKSGGKGISNKKEVTPLDRLKNLEDKITGAIEKVKTLKEEKAALGLRIEELEAKLSDKDHEIEKLQAEKTAIKSQVECLLNELDTLEAV
jgi:chromosome segregation ATPase